MNSLQILPIWQILFLFLFASLEFTNYSYSSLYITWLRKYIPIPIHGKNNYLLITGLVQNRTFKQSQKATQRLKYGLFCFYSVIAGHYLEYIIWLEVSTTPGSVFREDKNTITHTESQRDMAPLFCSHSLKAAELEWLQS